MIKLTTPIKEEDVQSLKIGDKVLITGTIFTARDAAHKRLINEKTPPIDLQGAVIFYVGPTPTKPNNIIGSCGPTSSYRMDELTEPLLQQGLKLTIGKGDRSPHLRELLNKYNAAYLIATGGAGALLNSKIKQCDVILYDDLQSEAIHKLVVEDFPCIVAYDAHNQDIFNRGNN